MNEWIIKVHPNFFKDLDKIGNQDLKIFFKKKQKIKANPRRQKHLSGGQDCYREPISENIRLIYFLEGNTIWLLTIGKHKQAYKKYFKRLYSLRTQKR